MPADLADSPKAEEEERNTDQAPPVAATDNEVAIVTATIETNFRESGDGMKGDLTETETESKEASPEWEEKERQKSRADELRSRTLPRRSSPHRRRFSFAAQINCTSSEAMATMMLGCCL